MPADENVDHFEVQGVVSRIAGHGFYEVKVGDKMLLATICGKMHLNHISVLPGDAVTCHVSIYDMNRCVIRYRHLPRR